MLSFHELGIDEKILRSIKDLGFEEPMPVQEKVIPFLNKEKITDLIALAQTGTGKTAAYGIPILQKADTASRQIQFLVLSPTRELCLQISDDLAALTKYNEKIKIAAVFGGASIERQIEKIKKGVHIISATPGRLVDLINRRIVDLSNVKIVVLDEADEMLNMGFRDELEAILAETPKSKNILLFSATMPAEVQAIAGKYMKNPAEITIGKKNTGAENVEHICYMVQARDRYLALKRIVDFNPEIYGIVFCRTRKETQEVADLLIRDGYNADALHGDLSQPQRDAVMGKFRIKHLQLLVATDVAARGLDVDNLSHIVNYNIPEDLDVYTHRSGRTGRAGRKGVSVVIANLKEKNKLQQIEKKINKKFAFVRVPNGKEICEKQLFHLIDRMEKVEVDYSQIDPMLPDIFRKLEWLDREELIKKFVSVEFNRFLEYYRNAADLNIQQDKKSGRKKGDGQISFSRFFINLGKTDGLKPSFLIGLINEFTNIRDIEVGEIDILNNFSFFEVDSEHAAGVFNAFKGKSYKKRKIVIEPAEKSKRTERKEKKDNFKKGKELTPSRRAPFAESRSKQRKKDQIKKNKKVRKDKRKN